MLGVLAGLTFALGSMPVKLQLPHSRWYDRGDDCVVSVAKRNISTKASLACCSSSLVKLAPMAPLTKAASSFSPSLRSSVMIFWVESLFISDGEVNIQSFPPSSNACLTPESIVFGTTVVAGETAVAL